MEIIPFKKLSYSWEGGSGKGGIILDTYTTEPLVAGNYFTVERSKDITVQGHGRTQINEIMLYGRMGRSYQNNSSLEIISHV